MKEINHAFITLVPKNKSTASLNEFCLIACCNVHYKIISKILVNRLQKVMNSLVSQNQTGFIKGWLISDSILLSHEMVQGFSSSSSAAKVVLQVDLEKAYDTVRRKFLSKVLEYLGFSHKWILCIKQCVGSPSCSIIINGTPTGYIISTKCLRQGDPLSPYLFTLVMESLTIMLETKIIKGSLTLQKSNFNVSHLTFVDDVLIFNKGDLSNLSSVERVFQHFAAISGLQICKEKSALFLSKSCKKQVANSPGFGI